MIWGYTFCSLEFSDMTNTWPQRPSGVEYTKNLWACQGAKHVR